MNGRIGQHLGAILLFFAWGFVMHAAGLLLHEMGGHALAAAVLACGIDGYKLTFFGHGQVHYAPCQAWSPAKVLVADWAGLAVTISAGAAAALLLGRRGLSPMARLLLALVGFFFLLGQLGYATSGGFHDLYDPGRTARRLGALGVHVLAWLPFLVAYAVSAFYCARAATDAFREHFGSRSRGHALVQLVSTLGVAGALYFLAFRVEWALRTDVAMRGVAHEAERRAVVVNAPKPFPIDLVLVAVAVLALAVALARPVTPPVEDAGASARPRVIPPRVLRVVVGATAGLLVVMILLVRR